MKQPVTYTAYRIAVMIIESEDFELKIDKDENGDNVFKLVDNESANLGDIESDEFYDLATVIDRLENYHSDYYYREFEEKRNPDVLSGKTPPNISDGRPFEKYSDLAAICWFITNSADILSKITPDVAIAFDYDMALNLVDRYDHDRDTDKDCLHYYVSKMLFHVLFKTLSAYRVVECNNHIYCTAYGDAEIWKSDKEFHKLICEYQKLISNRSFHIWLKKKSIYESFPNNNESLPNDNRGYAYCEMLEREEKQIIDDLKDLGKEGHYFDEYAFAYLGLLDEYDKN